MTILYINYNNTENAPKLSWRNRLARTAVNREDPGSSPGGSVFLKIISGREIML